MLPKVPGRPYKRKSDKLWVSVIDCGKRGDGTRHRITVARKSRNDCIDAASEKLRMMREGIVHGGGRATVASWLDHWLENIASRRLRPTSIRTYRSQIVTNINPHIGEYRLDQLTPTIMRDLLVMLTKKKSTRKADGKPEALSSNTIKVVYVVLLKALREAEKDRLIERNPMEHIDAPGGVGKTRGALELHEARQLIESSIEANDPMVVRWTCALLLGARQGELLGLTWDRVDFDAKTLDLSLALVSVQSKHGCEDKADGTPSCGYARRAPRYCTDPKLNVPSHYEYAHLAGSLVLARPKTDASVRVVPMIGPIEEALLMHRETQPPNPYNLVWTSHKGKPIVPSADYTAWQDALKRAGLPKYPLHSARHTAATIMQDMDVPEQVRMQIMGHNTVAAHRGYAHVQQTRTRSALETYADGLNLNVANAAKLPELPA